MNSTVAQLQSQNAGLRNELEVLGQALDEALTRQERGRTRPPSAPERELQTALSKIQRYKREIAHMKQQLAGNLNEARITDLENQGRYLSRRIIELESENEVLCRTQKEQHRALDSANSAIGYSAKVNALQQETRALKERYRELLVQQKQNEKVLKEQHAQCVGLEVKHRKAKNMLKQKNNKQHTLVSTEDLETLEDAIRTAEHNKKTEEHALRKTIKRLEGEIAESKLNIDTLKAGLRTKDRECRRSMLGIKGLKRATQLTS